MSDRLLTIGELARRAGVSTAALRYYEELGLLPTAARIAGQRRYPESAVGLVGIILLLGDVGFSLAERKAFMASHAVALDDCGGSFGASSPSSMTRSPRPRPPARPSFTRCAARTKTSSNAPTSPASSPPASPVNRSTKPTGTSADP
jgi:DNA-binding transcriptional MerR regulator